MIDLIYLVTSIWLIKKGSLVDVWGRNRYGDVIAEVYILYLWRRAWIVRIRWNLEDEKQSREMMGVVLEEYPSLNVIRYFGRRGGCKRSFRDAHRNAARRRKTAATITENYIKMSIKWSYASRERTVFGFPHSVKVTKPGRDRTSSLAMKPLLSNC